MAKIHRFRNPLFSRPFMPLLVSFLSSTSASASASASATNQSVYADIRKEALHLLDSCHTANHLLRIQASLIVSGLFRDLSFSGRLLKLSSNLIEDLSYTLLIFKCIDFPNTFCVNSVIKNYSCRSYHGEAVLFYVDALRDGNFSPNGFTFPPLISACAKISCLSVGQTCHGQAVKFGVDSVLPVRNSLVHLYAACGLMNVAYKVFDEMPVRDLVSWNTVVDGFAKAGEMGVAHKVFDVMPWKNVVSWNAMITGYLNFRNPGNALKLFREMMALRFEANDFTMVNVVVACGRSNRLKEGRSVHGWIVKEFLSINLIIDTALVDMYSKCGCVDVARVIFDRMPRKSVVSWNAMILGHCIHGNPVDGLRLYSEMVDKVTPKFDPDELTFVGLLCACARMGMLTEGLNYVSQMKDVFHVKPNFAHYWCLANLMSNVGLKQEAVSILRNVPPEEDASPEYSLWAGLFGSCRFLGDVAIGEQIAKGLIEQEPQNFSLYKLLVNVYAVAGRWEEVAQTKEMMKERGIRRVPCCNLKDLKEIVCNMEVGGTWQKDLQSALMK